MAHHLKGRTGAAATRWQGGITHTQGYVRIFMPGHPKANPRGYVYEHILVAERVLGKPLPSGAMPHHANEDRADNRPENLVICQDRAYHLFLHQRMRAFKASGHANWRKCKFCKKWDDPAKMYVNCGHSHHRNCRQESRRTT